MPPRANLAYKRKNNAISAKRKFPLEIETPDR